MNTTRLRSIVMLSKYLNQLSIINFIDENHLLEYTQINNY
jgi:hypothetical protein